MVFRFTYIRNKTLEQSLQLGRHQGKLLWRKLQVRAKYMFLLKDEQFSVFLSGVRTILAISYKLSIL